MKLPEAGFLLNASPALLRLLEGIAREISLRPGEVLFEQGDEGDALFAIVDGALEISVTSVDGRKLALDKATAGDLLGEIALFDPGPRTATVAAIGATTVLKIKNADMITAIRGAPDLAVDMIRLAGERMRYMSRQIGEQVFLPIPARLARKVIYLLDDANDGSDKLKISQANLAEFIGATREAVSKTLAEWKREGVVNLGRGTLSVTDRETLEKIADLDLI